MVKQEKAIVISDDQNLMLRGIKLIAEVPSLTGYIYASGQDTGEQPRSTKVLKPGEKAEDFFDVDDVGFNQ